MSHSFILVINSGSSSVKFALYDAYAFSSFKPLKLLSEGIAELTNTNQANISIKQNSEKTQIILELLDGLNSFHSDSLKIIISGLNSTYSLQDNLLGIGHRVVHGGNIFSQSVIITNEVLDQIKLCAELAPLHNPANILGIEELQRHFPNTKQTAIFDTAFHQTIPDFAYTYAIPKKWTDEYKIRRYGFHGTSHRYITQQTASYLEKDINEISIISAHLGNGASVAAIKNGLSVDTSMGMTPLEGLVMGTRSGDIDPGIFDYLINKGISSKEINQVLNKKSGLLGLSDLSHDMRTLSEEAENGHQNARLALEVFCFRAAKYIAAMTISLTKLDALVFTGGIGENSTLVRAIIIKNLSILGFDLNQSANESNNLKESLAIPIHAENSRTILIIPTDEEAMIVIDTLELIQTK
jgi:acetate kinase